MFRELDLSWAGKSVRLKPTMDLLRFLEQRDLGPHYIANLIASRKVAPATLADFIASVLQYAGLEATAQEVFEDAHTQEGGFNSMRINAVTFAAAMLPSTLPTVDDAEKKPKAPARRRTPAKAAR